MPIRLFLMWSEISRSEPRCTGDDFIDQLPEKKFTELISENPWAASQSAESAESIDAAKRTIGAVGFCSGSVIWLPQAIHTFTASHATITISRRQTQSKTDSHNKFLLVHERAGKPSTDEKLDQRQNGNSCIWFYFPRATRNSPIELFFPWASSDHKRKASKFIGA